MKTLLLTQALKILVAEAMFKPKNGKGTLFNIQKLKSAISGESKRALMVGIVSVKNRIAMAPMTRCRAIDNLPNELMSKYYKQRASAGLIITEGTAPSPNGLGYARMPGIFTKEQTEAWRKITLAVHRSGGKIFVQLMHTGRISDLLNMPLGSKILAPSAIRAAGQMWTDSKGMQDLPVPTAMSMIDIGQAKKEFVAAALNAMKAKFDGVELHAANGYLLEQFISPISNTRTDNYGGSIEKRCRFVLEVVAAVAEVIGKNRTGIRLSPYGLAGDMKPYSQIDATYKYLAEQLNRIGIAYIHLVDHSSMGAPEVPLAIKKTIRNAFENILILSGGYTKTKAEDDVESGLCDMVAFGRPFINNPDLVQRFLNNVDVSEDIKTDLFYSNGDAGYTDYPLHNA